MANLLSGLSGFTNSPYSGPLVGGGLNLLGSLMTQSTQRSAGNASAAMSQFNPWGTSNAFGSTSYGNGQINQQLAPWAQNIATALQGVGNAGAAGAGGYFNQGDLLRQLGIGDVSGLYGNAQNFQMPQAEYDAAMSGMRNTTTGLNNLFNTAQNSPYALEQMQMGRNLMANSYGDVEARRLQLLREGAAPFEERAQNSLLAKLHAMGGLGGLNTGGSRDIESFGRGLGQADTSRQLDAMGFAEGLYGRDQALGAQTFNSGVGNYNTGLDLASRIGATNIGANTDMLNAALNFNNTGFNRAQQKMANAQALFGFGGDIADTGANDAESVTAGIGALTDQQLKLAELGGNFGATGAQAGANAGKFNYDSAGNPVGAALSGLGNSLLNAGGPLAGIGAKVGGALGLGGAGAGLAGAGGAQSAASYAATFLGAPAAGAGAAGAGAAGAAAAAPAAAAGGGGGFMAGLTAAAPWVAGALAVGAVVANNMPKSSPLNNFSYDPNTGGGWTKPERFDGQTWQPQELNKMFGPAIQAFAQSGNTKAALAAIPPPSNEREKKMLEGGIKALFGGTGNPFRVIADKRGFGQGEWTAGSAAKQAIMKELGLKG